MDIKIPKPYHWKTFELLCEALWEKNGNVDFNYSGMTLCTSDQNYNGKTYTVKNGRVL